MKWIILIFCNTNYIVYESLGWTYLDWEGAYPTECFPVRGGMFSWSEQQPTSLSVYYSLKGRKVSIMGSQDLSQRYSSYCSDSWEHGAYGLSPPCPVYTNLTESHGRCGPLPLNQPKGSSGYIIFKKMFCPWMNSSQPTQDKIGFLSEHSLTNVNIQGCEMKHLSMEMTEWAPPLSTR